MPSWWVSRARRWAGPGHRARELVEQDHAADVPLQCQRGLGALFGEQAKLGVSERHARAVAEFFGDGEGFCGTSRRRAPSQTRYPRARA